MKRMKKIYILLACVMSLQSFGQVQINEFLPETGQVELINIGDDVEDATNLILCSFPVYNDVGDLTLESGSLVLGPGEILVVSGHSMSQADDELGIYTSSDFTSSQAMIDYVEWGSHGHQRSTVAEGAGIWADLDFVPAPASGSSLAWDETSDASSAWHEFTSPNLGSENFPTAVKEDSSSELEVWPIPATELLNVKAQTGSVYRLFDLVGNLLMTGVCLESTQVFDISGLRAGYYLLMVDNETLKVVVE